MDILNKNTIKNVVGENSRICEWAKKRFNYLHIKQPRPFA